MFDAREALERALPETVALYQALPTTERDPATLALQHIRRIGASDNADIARRVCSSQAQPSSRYA